MIRSPAGFDGGDRIKRYLDYYQPSYGVMMLSAGQFSPASLFAAGEQGAWYDPSDFSTMFQDSAGTTPVTAVEQPVGLILDKSKGLALGSELVANGNFSTGTGTTGWTPTACTQQIVGSELETTCTVAGFIETNATITTVVGSTYTYTANVRRNQASGTARVTVGGIVSGASVTSLTATSVRIIFRAAATTTTIKLDAFGASIGDKFSYSIASVRELPGNHASQSTSASRPVLSARVNLLTYSEQFDNAAWTKQNGAISANAETAPNGTLTADKFTPTAAASTDHRVLSAVITTTGGYTLALYVKPAGYSKFGFRNGAVGEHATFNLSGAGTVIEVNSCTATITAEPNGWYKVQIVNTSASIRCDLWTLDDAYTSGNPGSYSYTGDGTSGLYIWGADLRVTNDGVGLPAYQRIAAATDYDTSGFPLYLRFDGTDDSLATASIDFSATDKMSVFAGVRKLSDAAAGLITELSANVNTNNGSFALSAPEFAGASGNYAFKSRGDVNPAFPVFSGTILAPTTNVMSGIGGVAGDVMLIRSNGVQVGTSSADQGAGNFGNYPLYIGSRAGASLRFNGRLYSLIVRGAQSTDAQIASTEAWVNGKTKAY